METAAHSEDGYSNEHRESRQPYQTLAVYSGKVLFRQMSDSRLLCEVQEMDDRNVFEDNIYNQAPAYAPPVEDEEGILVPMYDPAAKYQPEKVDEIPEEFVINDERRAYAMRHIADRDRSERAGGGIAVGCGSVRIRCY